MSQTYDLITDRVIALLEKGTVPWRKPWVGGDGGKPRNLKSGRAYRGVNIWLLACQGYASPWWLTFKQAKALGGHVRRGEKGTPVVLWRWLEREDDDGETRRVPLLRHYTVFNAAQCDDVEAPAVEVQHMPPADFDSVAAFEHAVAAMPDPPAIHHDASSAFYRPKTDSVHMPPRRLFVSPEEWATTLAHELAHATGAAKRLNRSGVTELNRFGSHDYSQEELVAEMAACYVAGHCGISHATMDNSAAYLAGWLRRLRSDKRLVVTAAAQAQKAADWILGTLPEKPENKAEASS